MTTALLTPTPPNQRYSRKDRSLQNITNRINNAMFRYRSVSSPGPRSKLEKTGSVPRAMFPKLSAVPQIKKISFFGGNRKKSTNAESNSNKLSKEEVTLWATGFERMVQNKHGLNLFRAFLQREFSEENIEFWIAVQEFKAMKDPAQMQAKAREIHEEFVAVQSPKEVNLDSDTRSATAAALSAPTHEMFDTALTKVEHLMGKDSYPRFLKSDLYLELLNSCKK